MKRRSRSWKTASVRSRESAAQARCCQKNVPRRQIRSRHGFWSIRGWESRQLSTKKRAAACSPRRHGISANARRGLLVEPAYAGDDGRDHPPPNALGGYASGAGSLMDVTRDPRWGRVEETYGEDPYMVSSMSTSFVTGLQGKSLKDGVAATGKHFVGYGASEAAELGSCAYFRSANSGKCI